MAGLPVPRRPTSPAGSQWGAGQIPDNATGGAEVAPIEVEAGTDSLPIPSRT
jgi:hypothetical protein